MDLTKRVAVITGASRGLGAGVARAAFESGMSVVVCSRTAPALPEGPRVLSRSIDVSREDAVEELAHDALERFGRIDLWINNAGVLDPVGPLRDVSPDEFRRHIEINLLGTAFGSRAFVRALHATGRRGVLLNISSGAARHPYVSWSAYCAGKAGVDRLSECIAAEEGDRVKVHAVAPGLIDSEMQAGVRALDREIFPALEKFLQAHEAGALVAPIDAGRELLALAFDPARARAEVCIDLRD